MLPSIKVEGISKQYRIGTIHQNLRNTLGNFLRNPIRSVQKNRDLKRQEQELWALNDISFEARPGEVIGIVGRNGSGKSTLLKILSRITLPTKGRMELRGSLACLLEVGTGFNIFLTGRQNIFLNGSIMGMRQHEIRQKFDEIVEFANVGRLLDTPVKFYSSGMYIRLAFSIAAHLAPDILVCDEILAVGDGPFQKKCLGKLGEAAKANRTVFFVSHNLQLVRQICTRVIHLDRGELKTDEPVELGLTKYNTFLQEPQEISEEGLFYRQRKGTGAARFTLINAYGEDRRERWRFKTGETPCFELSYEVREPISSLGLALTLSCANSGQMISTVFKPINSQPISPGTQGKIKFKIPHIPLLPGDYAVSFALTDDDWERQYDLIDHNINLPWLSIDGNEETTRHTRGFIELKAAIS